MNRRTFVVTILAVAATWVLGAALFAQKVETKNISCNAEIIEVDSKDKAITVKIKDGDAAGKQRTVTVAGNTKIQKNDKINQKLKDLAVGDVVNLTYKKVKAPTADRKSMEEVYRAVQVIVTTPASADAATK